MHSQHPSPFRAAAAITAATAVIVGISAMPAAADDLHTYPVGWAPIGIYPRQDTQWDSAHVGDAIPDGTPVTVVCETEGESVTSAAGTSTIWDRLDSGAYLPNVFLNTGAAGSTPGSPNCATYDTPAPAPAPAAVTGQYDRAGAAQWAVDNDSTFPHRYPTDDCTWFVTHALWLGGGLPKTSSWTDSSHTPWLLADKWDAFSLSGGPTKASALADALKNELLNHGYATISSQPLDMSNPVVARAQVGDLIAYDWDPKGTADGAIDHMMLITSIINGAPLVTGQSNDVVNQRWQYDHTGALIVNTKHVVRAYLVHITL